MFIQRCSAEETHILYILLELFVRIVRKLHHNGVMGWKWFKGIRSWPGYGASEKEETDTVFVQT